MFLKYKLYKSALMLYRLFLKLTLWINVRVTSWSEADLIVSADEHSDKPITVLVGHIKGAWF